jgi:UDP-N-acetylglucosamine transferase subunit ALG13
MALPFSLVARALGAKIVFIETMARVETGSVAGRVLSRMSQNTFVQWPELAAIYPHARVCRPVLLEGLASIRRTPGKGTFVTLGSHNQPFERLLAAVGRATSDGILPRPVTIQAGVSLPIADASITAVDFLSPERFRQEVEAAEVVITHGGAGAIATVLRAGKRPIVMARRAVHSEHVDDHQLELVAKLGSVGLIVPIDAELASQDVAAAMEPWSTPHEMTRYPSLADAVAEAVSHLARSGRA